MYFFPVIFKEFETSISKDVIVGKLKKTTLSRDWQVTYDKVINHEILEGEFNSNSFLIVKGRYGLSYGRTSLLPIMKGYFIKNKQKTTKIKIVIRPYLSGIIILAFFYFLLIGGVAASIFVKYSLHLQFYLVGIVFIGITYGTLITKFNKEVKSYIELIEKIIYKY